MSDENIDTGPDGPIVSGEVTPAPSEGPRIVHIPDEKGRAKSCAKCSMMV